MTLLDYLASTRPAGITENDFTFLGTDISVRVLAAARDGRYSDREVQRGLAPKCATLVPPRRRRLAPRRARARLVTYRRLNLVHPYIGLGQFDVIFCRNVLIYFDDDARRAICDRLWNLLTPAGLLVLGSVENLYGISTRFESIHMGETIVLSQASGPGRGRIGQPPTEVAAPMHVDLPSSWRAVLAEELTKPYFKELESFVDNERKNHQVFPPEQDVFNAFKATPFAKVKVLLLGQDPYHDDGQAHGMCFSVRPGVKPPPSLVNMFKDLRNDLGCKIPNHGYLEHWAKEGVLLLNAVLTVRAHVANSHKNKGWEKFTDAVIRDLNDRHDPMVFALWGGYAQKKEKLIDTKKHRVVKAAHPSPLSASKFFGSKPFSAINAALKDLGQSEIDWQLPDL